MLIYDIEIHKAIPDRSGRTEEGIQYCEGWHDYKGMGIACIAAYDYKYDRSRIFLEDNLEDFGLWVVTQECIVGYNNNRFDNRILAAHGITILPEKSYDLLEAIWRAAGLGPTFRPETHGGYGLEAMARTNLGLAKSGHGADAPIRFQRGEIGTVVDYCLQDIALTKRLLDRVIRSGNLRDPKTGGILNVRKPGGHSND